METMHKEQKEWIERNPLRKYRKEHKMTIMGTAAILGCNFMSVQLWETGANYPRQYLDKIGKLIGDPNIEETWEKWYSERPKITGKEDGNE